MFRFFPKGRGTSTDFARIPGVSCLKRREKRRGLGGKWAGFDAVLSILILTAADGIGIMFTVWVQSAT